MGAKGLRIGRGEAARSLLERVDAGAVRLARRERREPRRGHQPVTAEHRDAPRVDGAPDAGGPPRREPNHVAILVHRAAQAVDPAKAQRLIHRLGPGHAGAAGVPLVESDPQLTLAGVIPLEPATEGGRAGKVGGLQCREEATTRVAYYGDVTSSPARTDPVQVDVGDRRGLEAVFRPRSIAVIGASRERGTVGAEIFHNLIEHGFRGAVYPVNPKADVVQSVHAYPTITDVPGPVDLAIIVVPAARVIEVVQACGEKGVRAVVVISAGFKEVGGEGLERERRLIDLARRFGMRVVGPNCLGVLNTELEVRMDATFAPTYPPAGAVGFSSQSGALGLAILEFAAKLGIGISQFVSVGNKADVSGNDLIEFWEHDPGTRIILLYLESFGNPRRFLEIARRVGHHKPIVAVKSGRTPSGMRAASSHTGSLAGADTAVSALCTQAGVIRTDTIGELFDVAMLLANQPVPRGSRVGIVTNAGGPGIMASDACETHGLEVVTLEDATVEALRAFLPAEASTRNPVDMLASATPESFEKAVRLVACDPRVDAVLVLYVPPIVTRPLEVAQAIVRGNEAAKADARARSAAPKPVLSCFMGSHGVPEGLRSLQEGHIPSYGFPESAAIALARAVRYGRWRETPEGTIRHFDDVDAAAAARILSAARERVTDAGSVWLTPD